MNIERTLLSLLKTMFILPLLIGCAAQPDESDLKRVREGFLHLRFQAALSPEYRSKSDRELFEISCEKNRVKCDPLLQLLKEKDPAFYEKLMQGSTR